MASGDLLCKFFPQDYEYPATLYARIGVRNQHPILAFIDNTSNLRAMWTDFLPNHYAGGGITVTICWMSTDQTSGNVKWDGAFERHQDDAFDLDSDGFAAIQTVTATTASVAGEVQYSDIAFTDVQIDGLLKNEQFRFLIERDQADAADTLTNNAEITGIMVRET